MSRSVFRDPVAMAWTAQMLQTAIERRRRRLTAEHGQGIVHIRCWPGCQTVHMRRRSP